MAESSSQLKRTFMRLMNGKNDAWRISVSRNLWPNIDITSERVYGEPKRWVHKQRELVRILWDDGEAGTHEVDQLIEHQLALEDGPNGEPAPEVPEAAEEDAHAPSASEGSSASGSEEDEDVADKPPLATARTKTGVCWKYELEGIKQDNRVPRQDEKPGFKCSVDTIGSLGGLFLYLAPPALLDEAVRRTNAEIADPDERTSLPEILMFYGYMLCLAATGDSIPVEDMWRTTRSDSFLPAPDIGRHGMSCKRFRFLMSHWRCGPEPERTVEGPVDPWARIRPLVNGFNESFTDKFVPGYMMTIDETMIAWRGRGLPHLSFVPRKPEPLGVEVKTLACSASRIICGLDIAEGKEAMATKPYEREYGHTTATTLRLAKPWAGSNRVILGDSWFASVKTAQALYENHRLYFLGVVKTNTAGFPMSALDRCPKAKGSQLVYSYTPEGCPKIAAVAHRKGGGRLNKFVATCFTTEKGTPMSYAMHESGTGEKFVVQWDASKMANRWTEGQPAIDAANRQRQEQLAMEKRFVTKSWEVRFQTTVLSIVAVNVFNGWTRVLGREGELKPSISLLGMQLIQRGRRQLRELRTEAVAGVVVRGRRPQIMSSPDTAVASLGTNSGANMSDASPRLRIQSPMRHICVSYYYNDQQRAGYQRKCVICGKHTSHHCSWCGPDCPVHPEMVRTGGKYTCLASHRADPTSRLRGGKRARKAEDNQAHTRAHNPEDDQRRQSGAVRRLA